jgi:hypothetical protein
MSELLQEIIEPILGKLSHPVLRPKSDAYRMCALFKCISEIQ